MLRIKLKKIDIIIALLYIAVFKIYAIPQVMQQALKIIFLCIVFLYVFSHVPIKKCINLGAVLGLAYSIPSIQGVLTHSITTRVFLDGVLYAVCIYAIYMVIQLGFQLNEIDRVIHDFYYLTGCYCVISFVSVLRVGTSTSGTEMTYFFGNKFSTCYFFIMLSALFYTVYFERIKAGFRYKAVYLCLCFIAIGMGAWTNCTTAMLGAVVLLGAVIFPDRVKKHFMSPIVLMIGIVIAGIMVFSITAILEIPQIQGFVVGTLGKSVGLTGRIHIYKNLFDVIRRKLIWGYGYNSSIVVRTIGYGNAQNGLMELMTNFGLVGICAFLWTVYYSISHKNVKLKHFGLYWFIVIMVICSIVEISYNYYFYSVLFLLRWVRDEHK